MASPASEQPRSQKLTPRSGHVPAMVPIRDPESSRQRTQHWGYAEFAAAVWLIPKLAGGHVAPRLRRLASRSSRAERTAYPWTADCRRQCRHGAGLMCRRHSRSTERCLTRAIEVSVAVAIPRAPTGLSALPKGPMVRGPSNASCASLVARDSSRVEGWVS